MITPRIQLVTQGLADFAGFQDHLEDEERLQLYGICGGMQNALPFDAADTYIGTYQSLSNMPDDMFKDITAVICDEGHTVKAMSVKECVSKCKNAELVTAISGTMQYVHPADALTIEQFCGPMVTNYSAAEQINKGRLPRLAMQQIVIKHTDGAQAYNAMLRAEGLSNLGVHVPKELASKYRMIEMRYLWHNEHLQACILKLAKQYTDQGKNVLVIVKNREPAVSLFELAKQKIGKAHLLFGSTSKEQRAGIKADIEGSGGWFLVATDGCMSMGVSINNLHALIVSMIGKSPHVVLQSVGRMLRNHPDKYDITTCYDIVNDCTAIGTGYDLANGRERNKFYRAEQHTVHDIAHRLDTNYTLNDIPDGTVH